MNYTIKIIALIIAIGLPFVMTAQDNTFNGSTNSDWDVATNWSTGAVPTSPITGVITIAANCTNANAVNYTFQSGSTLKVNAGISFTNNGTGTWTMQGTVVNEGTYTQAALTNDGTHIGTGTFVGNLTLNGMLEPGYTPPPSWICGDPLVYDGQSYATVQIGTQCWMAENLNIGTMINGTTNQTNNSTIEKYCYNNTASECTTYGGLYQWDEMMQYVTAESTQGVCPTGWHLPSSGEWTTLIGFLGGSGAGGKMKETSTTHWKSPNAGATNSSGFTGLPGGSLVDGSFKDKRCYARFWSSSESGSNASYPRLFYANSVVSVLSNRKPLGLSVRCVRD